MFLPFFKTAKRKVRLFKFPYSSPYFGGLVTANISWNVCCVPVVPKRAQINRILTISENCSCQTVWHWTSLCGSCRKLRPLVLSLWVLGSRLGDNPNFWKTGMIQFTWRLLFFWYRCMIQVNRTTFCTMALVKFNLCTWRLFLGPPLIPLVSLFLSWIRLEPAPRLLISKFSFLIFSESDKVLEGMVTCAVSAAYLLKPI